MPTAGTTPNVFRASDPSPARKDGSWPLALRRCRPERRTLPVQTGEQPRDETASVNTQADPLQARSASGDIPLAKDTSAFSAFTKGLGERLRNGGGQCFCRN
jgi:hypothetical protein